MESSESLTQLLERAAAALQQGRPTGAPTRRALVGSLLDRQIQTGRKAGLFAVSPADWQRGPRLWTGEPIRTKLAAEHVLSQEAARLLCRLGGDDPAVGRSVAAASGRLAGTCYAVQHCTIGECATSFIGYVRFLAAAVGDDAHAEIAPRIQTLSQHRLGDGRWKRFPLFYTALVLSELRLPAAKDELLYARDACIRAVRHNSVPEPYADRRAQLLSELFGKASRADDAAVGVARAATRREGRPLV
ncbi:MAG: hypothetical protein PHU43_05160 [Candidatus Bipolaricaulis sp.]|nr:hypothetical protein [Candidatus Bipolaricaulis sp.]